MKEKIQIIIIIILILILSIMCFFYFKDDETSNFEVDRTQQFTEQQENSTDTITNTTTNTEADTTIISTTSEVLSGLTENQELHSTYYLEEIYVEEEQEVEAGENILKYTNGTYLTAPYDCVINEINIPEIGGQCTSQHYIQISSTNVLEIQLRVDETIVDELSIGQEAQIEITALDDKTFTGNIINISNTASNGKFTVTVEFENDGEIKIGMTASIVI